MFDTDVEANFGALEQAYSMAKPSSSPCDLAIALATIPTLAGLVVMKNLGDLMIDLGLSSEEIFRGDRLPILNMPQPPQPSESTDSPPNSSN